MNASLVAHPEREELLLFGGEYFNGQRTFVYNDLYVYNIKKNCWTKVSIPNAPAPRCAHQAVVVPSAGGQMWIFGGEFASPNGEIFYHYKDLWVLHLSTRTWEEVSDFVYHNDLHIFDMDTFSWTRVTSIGSAPTPRSGCAILPTPDSTGLIVYGGYTKQRVKKDVEKGVVHVDMFLLNPEGKEGKWRWSRLSPVGSAPSPRSGFTMVPGPSGRMFLFGGVRDEEEEESLEGEFFNDLFAYDVAKNRWILPRLRGHDTGDGHRWKQQEKASIELKGGATGGQSQESEIAATESHVDDVKEVEMDDGTVFTVRQSIGGQQTRTSSTTKELDGEKQVEEEKVRAESWPCARMNVMLAVRHGVMFLYGGAYEIGDRQVTLADMYALDLHKLDAWHTLLEPDPKESQWLEEESSESEEGESEEECQGAAGGQKEKNEEADEDDDEDEEDDDEKEDDDH
uniref:Kelch domain containing 4 n=1 Tax=Eptatretus burgeri TaxID=7764 RepID=A0A8C4WVY3_EPTBU